MKYIRSLVNLRNPTPSVLFVISDVALIDGWVEKRCDVWFELWICPGLTLSDNLLDKPLHLGKFGILVLVYVAEFVEVYGALFWLLNIA